MKDAIQIAVIAAITAVIINAVVVLGHRHTPTVFPPNSGSGVIWEPSDRAWFLKTGGKWKRIEGKVI